MAYSEESFIKNIRYLRKLEGLTQGELGPEFGEQPVISRYETGNSHAPVSVAITYANRFHVTLNDLCTCDFESMGTTHSIFSVRDPNDSEEAKAFFRGKRLYIYYMSADDEINEGYIDFDADFDPIRKFLHGKAQTTNEYDCKLVIEDKESVYIYGTELSHAWRFVIMLPFPKRGKVYFGGMGILVHKDEGDEISGQRVIISEKEFELKKSSDDYKHLKEQLEKGKASISRKEDNDERKYIRTEKKQVNKFLSDDELKHISFEDIMGFEPDDEEFPYDSAYVLRMGICHLFASALAERFGYETCQIRKERNLHCFCRKDGKFIDANGVSDTLPSIGIPYEATEIKPMEPIEKEKYTQIGLEFAHRFLERYWEYYSIDDEQEEEE